MVKRPSRLSRMISRFVRHVRTQIVAGLLIVVPLWLTFLSLRFFFKALDSIFGPLVYRWFGISFPGLGFVLLFAFVYLIGLITRNIVGRTLVNIGESILARIPFVKNIYQATKQLVQTISLSKTMGFQRVVMVEYPRPGLRALAFVTNRIKNPAKKKHDITVFIPTTPNPTSGVFEMVPEDQVIETNLTIEEGIKMVVSGGLIVPGYLEPERKDVVR